MEKDNFCFGCGTGNPHGLHLKVTDGQDGKVHADFSVPPYLQGYHRIVHGGIIATLLDELMAHAAGRRVPFIMATARLEVSFRHPLMVENPIRIEAEVDSVRRKLVQTRGRVLNAEGTVMAEAQAVFIQAGPRPADDSE